MFHKVYDLLFEISNENRHEILLNLKEKPKRITDLTREIELTRPEAGRHVSRLCQVGLIKRDTDGFYNLTQFGEIILLLLKEYNFLTQHTDYINSHNFTKIPIEYLEQIGD